MKQCKTYYLFEHIIPKTECKGFEEKVIDSLSELTGVYKEQNRYRDGDLTIVEFEDDSVFTYDADGEPNFFDSVEEALNEIKSKVFGGYLTHAEQEFYQRHVGDSRPPISKSSNIYWGM